MWDLPRPGLEPVSPSLAGRFSTTAPPEKPSTSLIEGNFTSEGWWSSHLYREGVLFKISKVLLSSRILWSHGYIILWDMGRKGKMKLVNLQIYTIGHINIISIITITTTIIISLNTPLKYIHSIISCWPGNHYYLQFGVVISIYWTCTVFPGFCQVLWGMDVLVCLGHCSVYMACNSAWHVVADQ